MALCEALQAFLGAIVIRPVNKKDWQSNFKEESENMTATEDVVQWSSACPACTWLWVCMQGGGREDMTVLLSAGLKWHCLHGDMSYGMHCPSWPLTAVTDWLILNS